MFGLWEEAFLPAVLVPLQAILQATLAPPFNAASVLIIARFSLMVLSDALAVLARVLLLVSPCDMYLEGQGDVPEPD